MKKPLSEVKVYTDEEHLFVRKVGTEDFFLVEDDLRLRPIKVSYESKKEVEE